MALLGYPTTAGSAFIAQPGTGLITGGIYTYNPSNPFFGGAPTVDYWGQSAPSAALAPAATSVSTGVNPTETAYSLYGHTIPLSVFGVGRIGGEIISGPWLESGLASFIISFGVPADPSGTRDLREIAFDSEVVWTTNGATGVTTTAGGTFTVEAFTARFYQGTLTQAADTLESTHFGANANAYRPQILLAFSNLPLAGTKFGKIPYVSAVIGDSSGDDVNFGEMFERLAYSPWVGWTSSKFETTNITDGVTGGGLIIAQDSQFLQLIQQFGRFYPNWNIIQTDKLRITDRGNDLNFDVQLDKTTLTGQVVISRAEPNSVAKVLELSTIDPAADYTIVPSRAQTPQAPVVVTTSVKTDSAYLPVIMDAATRASIVTYTKYHEEVTRKKISFTAMAYGLELEPGDLVAITGLGADFTDEIFRVIETLHGANYVVEVTAESILDCGLSTDPHLSNVVLLLGFEGTNGETTGGLGLLDESPRLQPDGYVNGSISTAQVGYGTSSYLSSSSGGLFYGASFGNTDFNLSPASNTDQFTLEWSAYMTTVAANLTFIAQWHALGIGVGWTTQVVSSTELQFAYSTNGTILNNFINTTGAGLVANTWTAFCVEKDGTGKIRLYINGVMKGSATPANSVIYPVGEKISVGTTGFAGGLSTTYFDEIRLTKGYARYASDSGYTVSASAFPRT